MVKNSIESIFKMYKYVRKLDYKQDPDYDFFKYLIMRDI
jgi:hypothetical protein